MVLTLRHSLDRLEGWRIVNRGLGVPQLLRRRLPWLLWTRPAGEAAMGARVERDWELRRRSRSSVADAHARPPEKRLTGEFGRG